MTTWSPGVRSRDSRAATSSLILLRSAVSESQTLRRSSPTMRTRIGLVPNRVGPDENSTNVPVTVLPSSAQLQLRGYSDSPPDCVGAILTSLSPNADGLLGRDGSLGPAKGYSAVTFKGIPPLRRLE